MQIWAESGKPALPICNYSQILYQFLTFTQNLKRSLIFTFLQQQPKNNSSKNNFFNKGHEKVKYEFPFMIHQQ